MHKDGVRMNFLRHVVTAALKSYLTPEQYSHVEAARTDDKVLDKLMKMWPYSHHELSAGMLKKMCDDILKMLSLPHPISTEVGMVRLVDQPGVTYGQIFDFFIDLLNAEQRLCRTPSLVE